MKKKKVYVNKVNKKIHNNQEYYNISNEEINSIKSNDDLSVDDKLKKLFNTNGYIFNIDVKIITNSKTYNTKIAGKVGSNLITLDNDIININDIKDIVF